MPVPPPCGRPWLQVSGSTLQQMEKFKYLGVVFTSDGRWSEEIDTRIGKATAYLRRYEGRGQS